MTPENLLFRPLRGFSTASFGVPVHEPKDSAGNNVDVGTRVRLLVAPPELIDGLPEADQIAIQAAVGKDMMVEEFDQYGHAELMFKDAQGTIHFIWVKPSALKVLP